MVRIVSLAEASANADALFESIEVTKEPVVVQEGGKMLAVLVSPEEYERYAQARAIGREHDEQWNHDRQTGRECR